MKKSDLQAAARVLIEGESFLIAGHVNPDGDCLGSISSLALALAAMGKKTYPVCLEGIPDLYRFIPGSERILNRLPQIEPFDVGISVDSDRLDRLGPVGEAFSRCDRILALDHHQGGQWNEAATTLIDSTSASCGEIVYELLREAGVKFTKEIAESLLTAIVTDTGTFRFTNVKPSTLRIAADLMEFGAIPGVIANKVYETRTLSSARLLGEALASLNTEEDGLISYAAITREQIQRTNADDSETDGIVNFVRSVRGARVGILFRATAEGDTKASLRTSGDMGDISEVARIFGGGGHRAAAGCTVEHPLEESIPLVLDAVKRWMAS
jgi:phosphoesterase RecJ-like protein